MKAGEGGRAALRAIDLDVLTTTDIGFSGYYFGTNAPTVLFSPSSGITYSLVNALAAIKSGEFMP